MTLAKSLQFPILIVSLFWLIKLTEIQLGIDLYQLGIYPNTLKGLPGILFSPFLHGNLQHLTSNSPTFLILCASILYFYPRIAFRVILILYIFTGVGVWLLARPNAYHIGASGVIYGFASFLFFSGIFRKDARTLAISMLVALFYGSMLYGVFPQQAGVSWESHLIGVVAGGNFAFYFRNAKRKEDEVNPEREPPLLSTEEGYQNLENSHFKYIYKEKNEG